MSQYADYKTGGLPLLKKKDDWPDWKLRVKAQLFPVFIDPSAIDAKEELGSSDKFSLVCVADGDYMKLLSLNPVATSWWLSLKKTDAVIRAKAFSMLLHGIDSTLFYLIRIQPTSSCFTPMYRDTEMFWGRG